MWSDASDLNGGAVRQSFFRYPIDNDADFLRSTRAYGALKRTKDVRPPQRNGLPVATIIRHTGGPPPAGGTFIPSGGTPVPDTALKRDDDDHGTNLRSGLRTHSLRRMMTGGGQPDDSELDMPKLTEREKLADLEARQRRMVEEVTQARSALRDRYAGLVTDLGVEALSEREFRDLLTHAIRVGGAVAVGALKALPTPKPA